MAQTRKRPDDGIRRANACLSAAISVLFSVHACLGAAAQLPAAAITLGSLSRILLWAAVLASAAHLVLSVLSTDAMLKATDPPASPRKLRHQLKKWLSAAFLLLTAAIHQVATGHTALLLMAAASAAICLHANIGAKSLLADLGLSTRLRLPLCIVLCIFCAIAEALLLLAALL